MELVLLTLTANLLIISSVLIDLVNLFQYLTVVTISLRIVLMSCTHAIYSVIDFLFVTLSLLEIILYIYN